MTTDEIKQLLEKMREVESTKRSLRQCNTGQDDLNKAISFYLKVGFEDGHDSLAPLVLKLVGALQKIDQECLRENTVAWKIANDSLEEFIEEVSK